MANSRRTSAPSEKALTAGIREYLKTVPDCWFVKYHASAFTPVGVPDILICYRGRFLAVEVKSEGRYATAPQKWTIARIIETGGQAIIARSVQDVRELIEGVNDG